MTRKQIKHLTRTLTARPRPAAKSNHDPLPRIAALTSNARNTWFALLGVLVFVGVTLMGVEHIDFWGVNRTTELPLVGVNVPTRFFFLIAPVLTTVVYCYFHIYLIRLWTALGRAEGIQKGVPLGDQVTPWLVTDAALYIRQWLRGESPPCFTRHALEFPTTMFIILVAWAFGPSILGLLWWKSHPANNFELTGVAGICLFIALVMTTVSISEMLRRMNFSPKGHKRKFWRGFVLACSLQLCWRVYLCGRFFSYNWQFS